MRGGALPMFVWGSLLVVAMTGNWIVTGDAIQVACFGFAILVVFGSATVMTARSRQSIRRGPPERNGLPQTLPQTSLASVGLAAGCAAILFGFVWSSAIVYFGAGMVVFSGGRLWIEMRAQRAAGDAAAGTVARSPEAAPDQGPAGR